MNILIASSNPHKVGEIHDVFAELAQTQDGPALHVQSLADAGVSVPEPEEDGHTFEDNALLKARYYASAANMVCLADDSGLEVDALNGDPGVRSARYAGVEGERNVVDPANNKLLLEKLGDLPASQRQARFVCAMALVRPGNDAPLALVRGTIEGRIIGPGESARGENGFGYDPLFVVERLGKTTAELPPQEKNAISHRGQATRLMWEKIRTLRA